MHFGIAAVLIGIAALAGLMIRNISKHRLLKTNIDKQTCFD